MKFSFGSCEHTYIVQSTSVFTWQHYSQDGSMSNQCQQHTSLAIFTLGLQMGIRVVIMVKLLSYILTKQLICYVPNCTGRDSTYSAVCWHS